jgi:hypothetical protein
MKGKAGLVVGIAVGYVLGSRAGRERYEQIKTQWLKVWNLDVVQDQVGKVNSFAKSSALALPTVLWESAVKATKAATSKGSAGQKLDRVIKTSRQSAVDVAEAAETTAGAVKDAVEDVTDKVADSAPAAKKTTTTARKTTPAAKKPATKRTGA